MMPGAALYEFFAPLGPVWSAVFAGFAIIGWDGKPYLTAAGAAYLSELDRK